MPWMSYKLGTRFIIQTILRSEKNETTIGSKSKNYNDGFLIKFNTMRLKYF